jgi:hypothetical protein
MEKKNYSSEIKELHHQAIEDIKAMMKEYGKAVVDLAGSSAPHAYVIGSPEFDPEIGCLYAEVMAVIFEDDTIKFDINWDMDGEDYLEEYPNENGDIGDLYVVVDATDFEKLIPCAGIETVYQAVWDYLYYGYTGDDDEDIQ